MTAGVSGHSCEVCPEGAYGTRGYRTRKLLVECRWRLAPGGQGGRNSVRYGAGDLMKQKKPTQELGEEVTALQN